MAKKKFAKKAAAAPRGKAAPAKAGKKKAGPAPKVVTKPSPAKAARAPVKVKKKIVSKVVVSKVVVSKVKAPATKKGLAQKKVAQTAKKHAAQAKKAVPAVPPRAGQAKAPVSSSKRDSTPSTKVVPLPKASPALPASKAADGAAPPVPKPADSIVAPLVKPVVTAAAGAVSAPVPAAKKAVAPAPAAPLRVFVPDRPRSILGVAALPPGGMPEWWRWHQDHPGEDTLRRGTVLTSFNLYAGIFTDTLRIHMAAGQSGIRAVSYSSKFNIDGDGSGGKQRGDTAFKDDTALHFNDGHPPSKKNALNSLTYPFASLPLPPKTSSIPDFHMLGLGVGDIGIAFFGRGQAAPFIYGNEGPPHQVGEGSVQMAQDLGLEWEEKKMTTLPPKGGFGEFEMRQYAPGVLHIAFPGSRDRPDRTTDLLTREALQAKAWELFKRWKQSLRGGVL